jgi:hypothetical protein
MRWAAGRADRAAGPEAGAFAGTCLHLGRGPRFFALAWQNHLALRRRRP